MNIFEYIKERISPLDILPAKNISVTGMHQCPFCDKAKLKTHNGNFYCFACHHCGDSIGLYAQLHCCTMKDAAIALLNEKFDLFIGY